MKRVLALVLSLASSAVLAVDVYHQGYMRSDGTYVQPYLQQVPGRNPYSGYPPQGNANPYVGQHRVVQPHQPVQPMQPAQPTTSQPTQPMQPSGSPR